MAEPIDRDRATWKRALSDPAHFEREQARLQLQWTFLGLTTDLPADGDWIRRDLWGYSVFVQRYGSVLKGFENRCAHHFFPLRLKSKGNGPVRCGFHGWQYDRDGVAVGVPMCKELFGCTPRDLDARLRPLEIAICGHLIFGRFAGVDAAPGLSEYLGAFEPILRTMSSQGSAWHRIDRSVAANWKFAYHISLEDYHIVAVHPSTFGAHGPLRQRDYRYFRCDPHSTLIHDEDQGEDALTTMRLACEAGGYEPKGYRIFHVFPNLTVVHYRLFHRWYVLVMEYAALAVDRTVIRTWYAPANFTIQRSLLRRAFDRLFDIPRNFAMRYGLRKITGEDNAVIERLQSVVHQAVGLPILGAQEERIAWFEEAYARCMARDAESAPGWGTPRSSSAQDAVKTF